MLRAVSFINLYRVDDDSGDRHVNLFIHLIFNLMNAGDACFGAGRT